MKLFNSTKGSFAVHIPQSELLKFFWDSNPDKSKVNQSYIFEMVKMILRVIKKGVQFTPKQHQWILSKIRFILKRNKSLGYSNISVDDFVIIP
jgi:hypothetical protein